MGNIQTFNVTYDIGSVLNGMETVYETVRRTLGPCGRNVIIQPSEFDVPYITNDGVTIAKSIILPDSIENAGALLLKESSIKTNEMVGDGTTTSCILAYNLIKDSSEIISIHKSTKTKFNTILFTRYIKEYTKIIEDYLYKNSIEISSEEDIINIAKISSNDEEIGKIVAKAIEASNHSNSIIVENSSSVETYIEKCDGFQWKQGLYAPFMADERSNEAEMKNPVILLIDQKLSNISSLFQNILEPLLKAGRTNVMIVCQGATEEILYALLSNKSKINVVIVKPNGVGNKKFDFYEDLQQVVGNPKVITELENIPSIKDIFPYCGTISTVKINKTSTTLIGYPNQENVNKYAKTLLSYITMPDIENELKVSFEQRANTLLNQIVSIKVGATTENELKEKKFRIEDAINACLAAISKGVSKGSGLSYIESIMALPTLTKENTSIEPYTAYCILINVLCKPFVQNLANCDIVSQEIVDSFSNCFVEGDEKVIGDMLTSINEIGPKAGMNLIDFTLAEDMFTSGIIDPTKVLVTALNNAVSVACLVITTNASVIYAPKEEN